MKAADLALLGSLTASDAVRFMCKVERKGPGDCWPWRGYVAPHGYGTFSVGTKPAARMLLAHRVAYTLGRGPVSEGMKVCHACDNPICCNPGHLFLGTQADNVADAKAKGRLRSHDGPRGINRGERNGRSKLTPDDVREIRRRLASAEQRAVIAQSFGVSHAAIGLIARGRNWNHVQ